MEAILMVRSVKICPSVLIAHGKTLEVCTAKYPLNRVDLKSFTIPSEVLGKTLDNVYLGQLPKRIIVGLVSNKAFNGSIKHNTFNCDHYNVNFLALYIDGQQVPSKALQPEVEISGLYAQSYHTLFSGCGIHYTNNGNAISRDMYLDGYCLYAFDLTPDLSAQSLHWNLIRRGSLRIEIKFGVALTEAVNCIVFGEFCNVVEVDKYRNVSVDFN